MKSKIKVPKKLKKELRKVDCLESSLPSIKMKPNPFSPSKMEFTQYQRVKLKEGVKTNKWTKRLVCLIHRELRRNHKQNMELAIKRQMDWIHKGINPMNSSYEEMLRSKSPDEFRREYMNEPTIPSLPSVIEFQDGERMEYQPANREEVEEFMRRCNLWPYMQKPDRNGIAILKLPSMSQEKLEEFKKEWEKWSKTSQPITAIYPKASIEFIPPKRPHRLHNHPRLEVQHRLQPNEVIIDREFVSMFSNAFPLAKDAEHWVVNKDEFLQRMEEAGGATDYDNELHRPRY